jgi:CheY-like chemotaxis protein
MARMVIGQPTETQAPGVVLVVDDEDDVRVSIADILRGVGYTVMAAADGDEALRLLTSTRFDAMVLDLKMPRRDGVSLLAALSTPPPVVVLSAHELDDDDLDRVGDAIVAYLRKPAPPQRLIDAVASAVIEGDL